MGSFFGFFHPFGLFLEEYRAFPPGLCPSRGRLLERFGVEKPR